MKTNIYIRAAAAISPLQSIEKIELPKHYDTIKGNKAICIEPNYKAYIPPIKARRMSRIIKLSSVSAKKCLKHANINNPEMINVATGMGCQTDTIKFLEQLISDKEQYLKPTAFINSTHNTLAGYLAIDLKSKGQNFSFTHNELNFEHALLDSIIRLNSKEVNNVLLGAVDEICEETHLIKDKMNLLCKSDLLQNQIFSESNSGYIDGENSVFFTLENSHHDESLAIISSLDFAYNVKDETDFGNRINDIAKANNFDLSKVDALMLGNNGITEVDNILNNWVAKEKTSQKALVFKHISGENMISAGFGVWLCANILKQNYIPNYLYQEANSNFETIDNILLINHNGNNNFSLIFIRANE